MALKGKQVAEKTLNTKRNLQVSEKSDGRKRKSTGVLQFFDEDADVDNYSEVASEEAEDDQDSMDEDSVDYKAKSQFQKIPAGLPLFPKEEELSDSELEILVKERYKPGSKYVVYADDKKKATVSCEKDFLMHSAEDPIIWRVKCMVGSERRTVFCLIRKFADRQSLGNGLKIASAFTPNRVKGYVYIEAERESDVLEACKDLSTIYSSKISQVPKNEVAQLFSIRNSLVEVRVGTWVRVKLGKYRGDLAQVVAFDGAQKSATIKIIPRIDLQAAAKKPDTGGTGEETLTPAARVTSRPGTRNLEKSRPPRVVRRDLQTGKRFETLDGLKLKDGYLYKKVSIESISYANVVPTADELLMFKPCKKDASDDVEWLSHLYGEQRKKQQSEGCRGTTNCSEGTSGAKKGNDFQLHDLVCFGPDDFGIIIGVESDDFQILKYHEVEGVEVLNVELHEIHSSGFDRKFTTKDHQMKATRIKDAVKVLDGPFKGRQGVVRHICKGIIFIFNENQLENGGYFCAKSELCENICNSNNVQHQSSGSVFGQGDVFGAQGLDGSTSSPKSPSSFKRPWQEKENNHDFNGRHQGDRDGEFSVGQTLRIRVGPLKGHLCRVISIRGSGLTVKVDSRTTVLSVKREHLSEVGARKQIDGLRTREVDASVGPTESNGWNSNPSTVERSSWPDFSTSDLLPDSLVTADASEKGKGEGNDQWGNKAASKNSTDSWGDAIGCGDAQKDDEEGDNPLESKMSKKAVDSWGNVLESGEDHKKGGGDCPWAKPIANKKSSDSWGDAVAFPKGPTKGTDEEDNPWGFKAFANKSTESWGSAIDSAKVSEKGKEEGNDTWGSTTTSEKAKGRGDNVISYGDDHGKSKEGGDDPWGSNINTYQNGTGSWENVADLGKEEGDAWRSEMTSEKATNSWGTRLGIGEDSGKGEGNGAANNIESGWGSTTVVQDTDVWGSRSNCHLGQDGLWSKATSWYGSNKSNPVWTRSETTEEISQAWRSGAGGKGENNSSGWGSASNQNTPDDPYDNQLFNCTTGANNSSGWGGESNDNTWGGGKSFGAGRESDRDWDSSDYSTRGGGFGRGGRLGSNRGGHARGRDNGAGESSGFPNRGRGFGQGGSSNRGGFGNRGRGRGRAHDATGSSWRNGDGDGPGGSGGKGSW